MVILSDVNLKPECCERTSGKCEKEFWINYRSVKIDKCMITEIKYLNKLGIKTVACCCGHGDKELTYISVEKKYINRMLRMGYLQEDKIAVPRYFINPNW